MGNYCKAYPISRLREYPHWTEKPVEKPAPADAEPETPERYLFLQQNFVVTDGIFMDQHVVFDAITPEWEEFCRANLEFSIPPEAMPEPATAA
jgi:hypothetical protein